MGSLLERYDKRLAGIEETLREERELAVEPIPNSKTGRGIESCLWKPVISGAKKDAFSRQATINCSNCDKGYYTTLHEGILRYHCCAKYVPSKNP